MRLRWKSTELGTDYARDWRAGFVETNATNRPTVLVETEDGAEAVALWRALGRQGYHMQWCPGPDAEANRRCSLVNSGSCPLVDRADVVLSHLDFTCAEARATLAALQNDTTTAPVVISAPTYVRARYPEIDRGATVIPDHLTGQRVTRAMAEALGSAPGPQA